MKETLVVVVVMGAGGGGEEGKQYSSARAGRFGWLTSAFSHHTPRTYEWNNRKVISITNWGSQRGGDVCTWRSRRMNE